VAKAKAFASGTAGYHMAYAPRLGDQSSALATGCTIARAPPLAARPAVLRCRCGATAEGGSKSAGPTGQRLSVKLFGWRLSFAGGEVAVQPGSHPAETPCSSLQSSLAQAGSLDEALEVLETALLVSERASSPVVRDIDTCTSRNTRESEDGPSIDPGDSTAALETLARLGGARAGGLARSRLKAALKVLLSRMGNTMGQYGPSELAGTSWALAKLRRPTAAVFQLVQQRVVLGDLLPSFSGVDLSRMLWAFASSGARAPQLFAAAAPFVASEVERLPGEALVDTLWAYAVESQTAPGTNPHTTTVFEAALPLASGYAANRALKPAALAKLLWAYSKARVPAPQLFAASSKQLTAGMASLKPAALARLAFAVGTAVEVPDPERESLLESVEMASVAAADKFNAGELADLVAGFSQSGSSAQALYSAVARQAASTIGSYKPKHLVALASAFVAAGYDAPALFAAVQRRSVAMIDRFTPVEMTDILWAFATCRVEAPELFNAVQEHMAMYLRGYQPKQLANTVWAYATTANPPSSEMLDNVEAQALTCLDYFSTDDIANTVWAYAKLGHCAPRLFSAVQQQVVSRLDDFNSDELVTILWSYVAGCAKRDRSFLELLVGRLGARRSELDSQQLCNLARVELALGIRHPDSSPLLPKELHEAAMCAWDDNLDDQDVPVL